MVPCKARVKDKAALHDRCNTFLRALLGHTRKKLTEITKDLSSTLKDHGLPRLRQPSSAFRDKMAEGREFESHGPYRSTFYDDVIRQANGVSWQSFLYPRDQ